MVNVSAKHYHNLFTHVEVARQMCDVFCGTVYNFIKHRLVTFVDVVLV